MEDWEDEIQEELNERVEEYLAKGLTIRQILGIFDTLRFELISNLIFIVKDEDSG